MSDATTTTPAGALPAGFPDPSRAAVFDSALGLVGNTPLVRVNRLAPDAPGQVYVKLDQYNVGGSSKDRIGIGIIRTAIARGELSPGQRIVDFGAGNTAIGYALAGIAAGHPVTLVAAPTLSPEKARLLALLGVDIVPGRPDVPHDDPENWAAIAARYEDEDPSTWWARQESTDANPTAHFESTGPEIWHQTAGRVTHFVAAGATGGTVSGTGRFLRTRNPDVRIVATYFQDRLEHSNLLPVFRRDPGWEDLERDFSANTDLAVIDRIESRSKADVVEFGWHVARTEGLVLGPSSILSLLVAIDLAKEAGEGDLIVSFSADSGRDYLTQEYNAQWLRENDFTEIADAYAPAATH